MSFSLRQQLLATPEVTTLYTKAYNHEDGFVLFPATLYYLGTNPTGELRLRTAAKYYDQRSGEMTVNKTVATNLKKSGKTLVDSWQHVPALKKHLVGHEGFTLHLMCARHEPTDVNYVLALVWAHNVETDDQRSTFSNQNFKASCIGPKDNREYLSEEYSTYCERQNAMWLKSTEAEVKKVSIAESIRHHNAAQELKATAHTEPTFDGGIATILRIETIGDLLGHLRHNGQKVSSISLDLHVGESLYGMSHGELKLLTDDKEFAIRCLEAALLTGNADNLIVATQIACDPHLLVVVQLHEWESPDQLDDAEKAANEKSWYYPPNRVKSLRDHVYKEAKNA